MSPSYRSGKDRRQINVPTQKDRRGKKADRRRCPKCESRIRVRVRQVLGGTVTSVSCAKCEWSRSSRQTDLDTLMAKLTWSMPLEKSSAGWRLPFPPELTKSLGLKAGDEFVIKPLTSPLGKLGMKWALTVQTRKK